MHCCYFALIFRIGKINLFIKPTVFYSVTKWITLRFSIRERDFSCFSFVSSCRTPSYLKCIVWQGGTCYDYNCIGNSPVKIIKVWNKSVYIYEYSLGGWIKDGVRVWLSFCSTRHANLAPSGWLAVRYNGEQWLAVSSSHIVPQASCTPGGCIFNTFS